MARNGTFVFFTTLVLVGMTGCSGDGDAAGCVEDTLRVATMNGGLARGDIAHVDERVQPLIDALAAEPLDLLCVQELWQDWDALVVGMPELPHAVRADAIAPCPTPSCSLLEGEPLLVCAEAQCEGLVGPALLQCGQDHCPDEVGALGGGCLSCVLGNAEGGVGAIEAACLSDDATESYLYECRYDTGILTSGEVVQQASLRLPSYLVAASVDYARVGGLDVFCTHLQSESSLAYRGDFDDWKDEQAHQIDALLAFIDEKNDGSRPVALLGDLNTGPSLPGIDGVWPDHYQRLLDAGLTNPFVAQDDVACTLCDDNTLREPGSSNTLIDHVLLRGTSGPYRRMLTEPTTLPGGPSHLSDHYGVAADVASCTP